MSQKFQACIAKAEKWVERAAAAIAAEYPRGTRIEYVHGLTTVAAIVLQHGNTFALNEPRVQVVGDSGRIYWIYANRITGVATK